MGVLTMTAREPEVALVLEEIFGERPTVRYESLTILHFHSIL